MDFNTFPSQDIEIAESMDKVLQAHFENIEKGNFEATNFCSDLQAIPTNKVDYRRCVQQMMKLTKDRVTGTSNFKMVHNLEKMMEILLENFTVKKSGVCEVLFFPSQDNEAKIIEYLKSAKKSIYVCVFTITNERLCTALLEAHLRGVNVKMITDDEEVRLISNLRDLSEEGIHVRTDNAKNALMHNKFVIIDQRILMTGSYNWTVRATKANQENVVILENNQLVDTFTAEFNKLWAQFTPRIFANLQGKAKKKTRLYHRYLEGLEKQRNAVKKAKLAAEKNDVKLNIKDLAEEEHKENTIKKGARKIGKKISKLKLSTSRFTRKTSSKAGLTQSMRKDRSESPKLSTMFLKLVLTMFALFGLIVFARSPLANLATPYGFKLDNPPM
jgi:hypothetical protein